MTSPDSPESPEELPFALQSKENFMEWARQPGNLDGHADDLRKLLQQADVPPELVQATQSLLQRIAAAQLVSRLQKKLLQSQQLLRSDFLSMEGHERRKVLAQAQAVLDEITNEGLDLPEPHRSNLLPQQVALCEQLRALKV